MPNYSPTVPTPPTNSQPKMLLPRQRTSRLRRWLAGCLLALTVDTSSAQTLARPGWDASGFNADPWWKRAVFYEVTPPGSASGSVADPQTASSVDFRSITASLDAAKSFGVDALILPMPASPTQDATLDSFDELMRQASGRAVHVLLTFSTASVTNNLSTTARFWLNRGVSGFYIVTPPETSPQDNRTIVQALKRITSSAVGGRVVISDALPGANANPAIAPSPHRTHRARHADTAGVISTDDPSGAQLEIDSHWKLPESPSSANLRSLLTQASPDVILNFEPPTPTPGSGNPYSALANAMAAVALTMRPAALIQTGQDVSLESASVNSPLGGWYRQLITLHHSNATLRSGNVTMLDFDEQNALVWVIRPSSNAGSTAPVVVACNLSSSPLRLSLVAAMRGLNVRGSYLRTLLRTDKGMGAQDLGAVDLPPFGVYIGELHR